MFSISHAWIITIATLNRPMTLDASWFIWHHDNWYRIINTGSVLDMASPVIYDIAVFLFIWVTTSGHRSISQIPQYTCWLSHNSSPCNRNVHTCVHFFYKVVHCRIWDWCIVGFVWQVYCRWACIFVPSPSITALTQSFQIWEYGLYMEYTTYIHIWTMASFSLVILSLFHSFGPYRKRVLPKIPVHVFSIFFKLLFYFVS